MASVQGLVRSAAALGDTDTANRTYATLQTFLTEADSDVASLAEVRSHATATTDQQQQVPNTFTDGGGTPVPPPVCCAAIGDGRLRPTAPEALLSPRPIGQPVQVQRTVTALAVAFCRIQ